jgi:hypothetical protein
VDKFFRWVWRINGLLLLPVSLLALLGVGAIAGGELGMFRGRGDGRGALRTTADGAQDPDAKRLRLGEFQRVQGTSVLWAPLHSDADWRFGPGSSYEPRETHNFLFYDAQGRDGRWLVEGNQRLFVDSDELRSEGCEKEAKTKAMLYLVAERDTDGNGRVNQDDALSVAISAPDGRGYQVVLAEAEAVHGWHFDPPSRLVVFHSRDGSPRVLEVDLETRATVHDAPLVAPH